jgi:hypothetical protein
MKMATFAMCVCLLGLACVMAGRLWAEPNSEPQPLILYADGIFGPPVTFSLGFDTTKYKQVGPIRFSVKEAYAPIPVKPNEQWIECQVSSNAADANCGSGKANMFYSSEDGVSPGGQLLSDGKTWIVTVRAQAPALGQAWRARVEVPVVRKCQCTD